MKRHPRHRLTTLVTVGVLVGLVQTLDGRRAADAPEGAGLIQRVLTQTSRHGISVRAIRELRAGTRSGKHQGWMDVETITNRTGSFTWKVLDEGGSERTRTKVFRELLKAEADSWRSGARDEAALTLENYAFRQLPADPDGQARFEVTPKRSDPRLVDGVLTVSADGYPLRLEGRLAKSPSFWVRRVTVVKRYDRVAGVALPISIESLADLKLFGQSTLTMRYRYSEVNGRTIPLTMASSRSFGPSPELLALDAARRSR